jgi:hypothetical protein
MVSDLLLVADKVPVHGAEHVVDLGRIGAATQNDHFNLRVVDVRDAIEDRLNVIDLGLDEVLHVQVRADRAAERLLAIVVRLELYRRREQAVATLALGSRPRQGVARLRESRGKKPGSPKEGSPGVQRKEARESKGRKPGSKGKGIGRVRAKRKPGSHHILPGV